MVIREGLTLPIVSVQARAVFAVSLTSHEQFRHISAREFQKKSTRHDSEK